MCSNSTLIMTSRQSLKELTELREKEGSETERLTQKVMSTTHLRSMFSWFLKIIDEKTRQIEQLTAEGKRLHVVEHATLTLTVGCQTHSSRARASTRSYKPKLK